MSLAIGTRLGPYEIVAPLGAGGMGEVYRARDTRLGRDVAVKVIPASLASDPDRVRRFEQEARAAAALSHPNILAVHDVGTFESAPYIVSELLAGVTLRERMSGGALPLRKATEIAVQVAHGLAAAHARGIVHRDLKPENVFVTDDGRVKILDFGLAKLIEVVPVSGESAATKPADTQPGAVMGTAGYMSPEQLRGQAVDHRSDIFAFGALLYELIAGQRAFRGQTSMDVATAILKEDPPDLPAGERHIPPALTRIVDRCLEKTPASRFQSAGDLAFALEALSGSQAGVTGAMPVVAAPAARVHRAWLVAGGLGLALVAAIAYMAMRPAPAIGPRVATMFPAALPDGWTIALSQGGSGVSVSPIAVSPNGEQIALLAIGAGGVRRIVIRSRDSLTARVLEGTDGAIAPFWSPDSQRIGYFSNSRLFTVTLAGGPPSLVCEVGSPLGGTWNRDGVIVFATNRPGTGLQRVADSGGAPASVSTIAAGEQLHSRPYFLPDGRHFLYRAIATISETSGPIYAGSLDAADRTHILDIDSGNVVYSSGHVLFMRQSTLMARRFDPDRLAVSGDPFQVADYVQALGTLPIGVFSASANGVLVYQTGPIESGSQLTWLDLTGTPVATVGERGLFSDLRLSPDNTRAAVSRRDGPGDERSDIWIIDLRTGLPTRFTFDSGDELTTVWSADSKQIVFNSSKKGALDLYQKAADNSGAETELLVNPHDKFPVDLSRDGKHLLYAQRMGGPGREGAPAAPAAGRASGRGRATGAAAAPRQRLFVLPLGGDRTPVELTSDAMSQGPGTFSPDGRWIVFSSGDGSGPPQVYVVPFPKSSGLWQISKAGGSSPRWEGPDGKSIYWVEGGAPPTLMMARVDASGGAIKVLEIKTLGRISPSGSRAIYGIARDGQRILINTSASSQNVPRPPPTVVVDWTLLKKR